MSTTTPPPTPTETKTAEVRNQLVATAKDLPDLIAKAQTADPALAAQLTSKAAVYSTTYYATLLAPLVAWAVSRWALGWDANTQALVVFLIGTGTAWIMRTISTSPIKGIFSKGATP